MTKHKHYDMIVAKAENMELACLTRHTTHDLWREQAGQYSHVFFGEMADYFLCLPEHTEACLNWLNGFGVRTVNNGIVITKKLKQKTPIWTPSTIFMRPDASFEVLKGKRKKWIVYRTDGAVVGPFDNKETADKCSGQVIEIEVL